MDRWTPRAAPVRNSRHRGHPAPLPEDYNVVIRSATGPAAPPAARTLTAMGRALVLNATELPLAVVPARRAVVLVLKEKAEVVQSNGAIFHSERIALEAPSVTSSTFPSARTRRSRDGRSSPGTVGSASTAGQRPRTSTTCSRGRGVASMCGRTWSRPAAAATRRRWTERLTRPVSICTANRSLRRTASA